MQSMDYAKMGKGTNALTRRPQLPTAPAEAVRRRCAVVVAKLDRLSRDVHVLRVSNWASIGRGLSGTQTGAP
jgi:hypothetical protein